MNDIIPHEPEKKVSYAEEKLQLLIEKSLKKMEDLDELCEEMIDDPKAYTLFISLVEKMSVVLERLFKIQNYNAPKDAKTGTNSNLPPITNALFLMNSADLLSQIESQNYGIKKRADLYLDE
jgi:hypothetical protein